MSPSRFKKYKGYRQKMIQIQLQQETETRTSIKAVGLLSGGLDSTLAARIIHDLGVEVYGVYFAMPWG